jgi:hypothetical protein
VNKNLKKNRFNWSFFLWVLVLFFVFLLIRKSTQKPSSFQVVPKEKDLTVQSFKDCAQKGYTVLETSPKKCVTPDSRVFLEE